MAAHFARVVLVSVLAAAPVTAAAQGNIPSLSKDQRQALLTTLTAVKGAATQPADTDGWQMHLLRASDGSHYVAFSAEMPDGVSPDTRLALYVRLAPRSEDAEAVSLNQRSAVEEWLLGQRNDPLPMRAHRVVQVPSGELPVGGPLSMSGRDSSGQSSAALALVERERDRQRAAAARREQERRAELEGRAKNVHNLLPFEDFDMAARVVARPGRPAVIRRALTSGPGEYDVLVGWSVLDAKNRPTRTGVLKHTLSLPASAPAALTLGSVIVAENIQTQAEMFRADQQTAHPYAIGATVIEPAADNVFTNDDRLFVAFQVINAAASATGKPDISIGFRLFRVSEKGEEPAGSLSPLQYSEATLPSDFDLNLGHPILAAMAAPLQTLPRGEYRLAIVATDRIGRSSAAAETRFRVIATPTALLASAPAYSAGFRRERFLEPAVLDRALDAVMPDADTPALSRLLALARERRFADLLPTVPLSPQERGTGALLQALGFFALGDGAGTVARQLRGALDAGAPAAVTHFWLAVCAAVDGHDKDAVAAWQAAVAAGLPAALVAVPVAEAQVRLGQLDEAGATARTAIAAGSNDVQLRRIAAAADVAAGRYPQAVDAMTAVLDTTPEDGEALWLAVHALFAGVVTQQRPGDSVEGRQRLVDLAARYIEQGGRYRTLADEWRAWVIASYPAP